MSQALWAVSVADIFAAEVIMATATSHKIVHIARLLINGSDCYWLNSCRYYNGCKILLCLSYCRIVLVGPLVY